MRAFVFCLTTVVALLACRDARSRPSRSSAGRDSAASGADARSASADSGANADSVEAEEATVTGFLDALARGAPPASSPFDLMAAHFTNVDSLTPYISDSGFVRYDINGDTTEHVTLAHLRSQIRSKSGRAYESFAHLGYMYSQPNAEDSKLAFTRSPGLVVVNVGKWYRLTFHREKGRLKLARLEFLDVGD